MNNLIYVIPAMGIVGLLYTFIKFSWVDKQDPGNVKMKEISTHIADGAMAFLKAEYKILSYFVVIAVILLGIMGFSSENSHWTIAISFICGGFLSALAGFIGIAVGATMRRDRSTGFSQSDSHCLT